jgi:GNAT superfamily N-acetyltransferase
VTSIAGPGDRLGRPPSDVTFRSARDEDLAECADIWRIAIDDYLGRLGEPALPLQLGPTIRLFRHLRSTDPERFVVAATGDERLVGFASAVERGRLWFLSMLFVRPEVQAAGLGRALMDRVMPDGVSPGRTGAGSAGDRAFATATDSAQPVSNALYATYGVVPRVPLLRLVGLPDREPSQALPAGLRAEAVPPGPAHRTAVDAPVSAIDRELLGFAHPADHAWLAAEDRRLVVYRSPAGVPVAYGYTSAAGRLGPVAALDADLLAPVLGHLMGAVEPRGVFATWVPGSADRAVVALLKAGLRLEKFPVLLCWDRPMVDFSRYLPISPGLL